MLYRVSPKKANTETEYKIFNGVFNERRAAQAEYNQMLRSYQDTQQTLLRKYLHKNWADKVVGPVQCSKFHTLTDNRRQKLPLIDPIPKQVWLRLVTTVYVLVWNVQYPNMLCFQAFLRRLCLNPTPNCQDIFLSTKGTLCHLKFTKLPTAESSSLNISLLLLSHM